ncbi:MAG TPA: hypothetical protein PKE04_09960 [Clostridia bacterium]|nr:hypothetical protein [Clostridia bacterium]
MKKAACLVALALVVCMAFPLGAAMAVSVNMDAAMPIVTEPFEVNMVVVPQSSAVDFKLENNWMIQYLNKETGLKINWTLVDNVVSKERIAMMCNSGDLPDSILGFTFTTGQLVQYGVSEKLFMPLKELIGQYAPTLTGVFEEKPNLKSAVTASDGDIYGFPSFSNIWNYPMRFFINARWLERVGMENPSTLEELKAVLTAFRDQDANGNGDPSDEIPWSNSWSQGQPIRSLILDAYGLVANANGGGNIALDYNTEDRQIVFMPATPTYKEYLYYMNGLWEEGLLDPDLFTQDKTQLQATVMEGRVGLAGMDAPYVADPEHQDDWVSVLALVSEAGKTPVFPGPTGVLNPAMMVISADVDGDTAAVLTKLADWFYTLEAYGFATYGPEAGSAYDYFNNGHYYDAATNTILYNMPANMSSAWTHRVTNLTLWDIPGFSRNGYDPYRLSYAKVYPESAIGQQFKNGVVSRVDEIQQQEAKGPYYVVPVPEFFFSAEDLERLGELQTPLQDYVALMEAKFITGETKIDAAYDDFIKTLEAYGVKEYMDIYQKYYEAYKAN